MKKNESIQVIGARVHNLKNISVEIPKNSFVVVTGPSGSGKSSLAFDTIYNEGQRRYIESLSSYAKQFIGVLQPPDVDQIIGLSPAIAIDQKTVSKNPRSTVGTITEVYDYLRLLFARVGELYNENGQLVKSYQPHEVYTSLQNNRESLKIIDEKTKIFIMAKLPEQKKKKEVLISKCFELGLNRFQINEKKKIRYEQFDSLKAAKSMLDQIEAVVIDRFIWRQDIKSRLIDDCELAFKLGEGSCLVAVDSDQLLSFKNFLEFNGKLLNIKELSPQIFSFNSPIGACLKCNGLGQTRVFNFDDLITDSSLPLLEGSIPILKKRSIFYAKMIEQVAEVEKVDLSTPLKNLDKKFLKLIKNGSDTIYKFNFESENSVFKFQKKLPSIIEWLNKRYEDSIGKKSQEELEEYLTTNTCDSCLGTRLNDLARSIKISNYTLPEICELSIDEAVDVFNTIKLSTYQSKIADKILHEIRSRLSFLYNVGLIYLTLNRPASTLSGGESQRIRLATQIGSALSGIIYVLDEPSIGLHQRDNTRLIETLKNLKSLGNTVIVVEHDEETILAADHVIDIGPGAGHLGGKIQFTGTPQNMLKSELSVTGQYLSKPRPPLKKSHSLENDQEWIFLSGASLNNLQSIDIKIPKGKLTCISGVSGSGKSTLIHKILVPAIKEMIKKRETHFQNNSSKAIFKEVQIPPQIRSLIELDQSPIGRTPHSNPATYTSLLDEIRTLFSKLPESQMRGYGPGRFSFNTKGGRCEECEGQGSKRIEMHFLPDVFVTCQSCLGKRYNDETLSVHFKEHNISDILNLSIQQALNLFKQHPKMNRILSTLQSVGLGYMKLGQPATTLSGGEAQRLKLCKELSKRTKGECLYILDEPTTGLHFVDIDLLFKAVRALVDQGNTVILIEHNLDLIAQADWIIDLGPEGGKSGGQVVYMGETKDITKVKESHTGKYLKKFL